jgi:thiol-disulfide isomerase/thioredoxin
MSTKALIGVLLAGTAGLIIFLYVHLSTKDGKIELGAAHAQACSKAAGDCLPDVSYVDTTGHTYTPDSLKGKVVVVNFWATWCHPCQKEIPDLSKLSEKYKQDVVVLGVLGDNPSDSELLNFQSDYAMSYPVVRASSDILTAFHYPQAYPTTFVFDKTGHQVGQPHLGAIRLDDMDKEIAGLIAQK